MTTPKILVIAALILVSIFGMYLINLNLVGESKSVSEVADLTLVPREMAVEKVDAESKITPSEFNHLIRETREAMTEVNINDSRMQDGVKIQAVIGWTHGPILDIGDPSDLGRNRLTLSTTADRVLFEIVDSEGRHFLLESDFEKFNQISDLELLWSSNDQFMSISIDQEIVAKKWIPEFSIFQDSGNSRQMIVGSKFSETRGYNYVREKNANDDYQDRVGSNVGQMDAYGIIKDVNVFANRRNSSSNFVDTTGYGSIRRVDVFAKKGGG
jgi:hypothetical protein|tara:strand:+ start:2676 stop:3485 length:810 start_codon:yes stop_codon:yes gene_type:complete